jgi:hypothetical protein
METILPNTTSEVTYDVAHKKYYLSDGTNNTDYFGVYFTAKSNLMAIEYIQD